MGRILVVEDERVIREGLVRALGTAGHEVLESSGAAEARALLTQGEPDCILLDIRLRDGDGLELLREVRERLAPSVPVVMATAFSDSERTIRAMSAGAFDYVTKPFDLARLLEVVARAVRSRAVVLPERREEPAGAGSRQLLGTSAAMLPVWKTIGRAANSDAPVLITGETGTGKEFVARAIHEHGPRARAPFVAVNLAALSPTLLESELFGHERGAFTGASGLRRGRLELAQGGTLFLDEIGDLEPLLQTKLLRFLQERQFERVGGTEPLPSDIRVIAATHRPVRPTEPGSTLREDLYYRLAVIELDIPPLRARKGDIPLLVNGFLHRTKARAVTDEAMALLTAWHWPGNVRELQHVIERAAVMSGTEVIDEAALPRELRACRRTLGVEPDPYEGLTLREALAALERRMLQRTLRDSGGNRAQAARKLGIARPQLYVKLREHGLSEEADPEEA